MKELKMNMITLIKNPAVIGIVSAAIGAAIVYFATPTKIRTITEVKTEVKTVHDKVYIDRVITKITKPDGTIEEITKEQDRSVIDSRDTVKDQIKTIEITNPKYLSLGLMYKVDIVDIQNNILNPYDAIGVWATYDTGILSTEIMGGVFYDRTVVIGLGVKF